MIWNSLSRVVTPGRPAEAELRRHQAYNNVFTGSPSKEDQHIVLADLMMRSGFVQVSPEEVSDGILRYREGKRALAAEVFACIALTPTDMDALATAARFEAAILS